MQTALTGEADDATVLREEELVVTQLEPLERCHAFTQPSTTKGRELMASPMAWGQGAWRQGAWGQGAWGQGAW